jgi:DNA-binding SARP family transcriptional activator
VLSLEEAIEYALAGEPAPSVVGPADSSADSGCDVPAAGNPDSPPAAIRAAPPALRVCALGRLRVYRDGELLSPDVWTYAKPRELLLYLLSHPKGRTREQIGLVFWPEASPAQVKNSFHVTLHHLRKALGRSEWIVYQEERYRIHAELGCEYDASLFEEQLTAVLREVRAGTGTVPPERLASVLGLYGGDLLEEESFGDWHLEMRDHLRRLWLDGMLALGDLLVRAERWAEGAEVYARIVRREDLHEEAHRRLMLCWAQAGERTRALRHYERLVVLLQAELDAEPEDETTALFERLRQGAPV